MYPRCDIDKARGHGETWPMDPELRDALNQVAVDLRGEIQTSAASFLHQIQGQIRESEERMRRHFDVVGESLRSDNRSVAEGTARLSQRTDRRFDEETGRTDRLEGRVLRLEVRVSSLEDDRKTRRPRRRR
jgi:light-regulated signal transduction histidine kinase (bacteriophytochrome)